MAHPRSETMDGRPPKSRGRGRFAPSPTGELHFGSIIAAVASFLDARSRDEEWLVRIDDVDTPRVAPGAGAAILRELERLELAWDGEIVHQSARLGRYEAALQALRARDLCFPCACTRRAVAGRVYPGTCRTGVPPGRQARSVRVRVGDGSCEVDDLVQGTCRQDLGAEIGDFIVYRADGIFAYHLATAVDDAEQGITRVIRGADLLFATLHQVYLQDLLGLRRPEYGHVPVATSRGGKKLSKQTRAAPTSARPGIGRGPRRARLSRTRPAPGPLRSSALRGVVVGTGRMVARTRSPGREPTLASGLGRVNLERPNRTGSGAGFRPRPSRWTPREGRGN